ncbi:MAG: PAS domain-containing sensor histidine kinase [Terriglobia bacterium]
MPASQNEANEALRESEAQFRTLAESMSAVVFIYQGDKIRYANPAAEVLTGYSRAELARMQFWDFIHPDFRDLVKARGLARQRGEPVPTRYEVKIIAKSGEERWFDITAGVATFEGKPAGLATAFDITDRKRIEEALRQSESRTRALLDAIPDLMFRYRLDGTYVDFHAHRPGELILPPEAIVGSKLDQLPLAPEIINEIKAASRRAVETGQVQTVEYTLDMPAGPQTYEARIVASEGEELVSLVRNITRRKQSEDALRRSRENLQALTAQLISAREEESKRLARELHDAFSQRLAVLGMEASALEQDPTLPGSLRQSLRAMGEEIGMLAKDVHQLSRELHPSILDDLGLTAALRAECGAFSRQYNVPVRFEPSAVPEGLSPAVSLGLYRIAQESLRNVGKHARATAVSVTLATIKGSEEEIRLVIEDNGSGFDLEQIKGRRGLGLVSMEERARLVEGSLTIRSQPGLGTTVEAGIPVRRSFP